MVFNEEICDLINQLPSSIDRVLIEKVVVASIKEGMRRSVHNWAWWRNGEELVGSGCYTKRQALRMIDEGE